MEIKQLEEIVRSRAFVENGARAERERLGLTLEMVAAPMKVEASTVARWETGVQRPRAEHAVMYEQLLRRVGRVRRVQDPRAVTREPLHAA